MASRFNFTPNSAEFPDSDFPELRNAIAYRPYLGFDAGTSETCYWSGIVPQGWTGTITAHIPYFMASATTGTVDVDVAVEAVSDVDAFSLTGTSFDTVNSTDDTTVPGTAGYMDIISVTLTNNDSSAAGDYIRFSLSRTGGSAPGDMRVLLMEIRDGA